MILTKWFWPLIACCAFSSLSVSETQHVEASTEWDRRLQHAEWVGYLEVEGVASLVNVALAKEPGLIAIDGYRYTANVLRGWKGALDSKIRFDVDLSDCTKALNLDARVLVFGATDYSGNYRVEGCSNVLSQEEAAPFMQQLDARFSEPQLSATH